MGFLSSIGSALGINKVDVARQDPMQYSDLYDKALNTLQGVGSGTADMRSNLQAGFNNQLAGLANNSAGRKATFQDDMSRSYAADQQNAARAAGGTGGLLNAQRASGANYDAQARGLASGYNDLYSQATKDLSTISGAQNMFNNQDAAKASGIANTYNNELAQRRNIQSQNMNRDQAANNKQSDNTGSLIAQVGGFLGGLF